MSASVLYDAPGPRTRRRVAVVGVLVGILLLGVLGLVVARLNASGQFTATKWGPLVDPSTDEFAAVWNLIGQGLFNSLVAAALAMLFSLVLGTALAVSRLTSATWYRWAIVGVIELLRGIPVVIAIFFAARVLPEFGIDLPTLWFLVIGLTAYNMVIIAEIVRAGVNALPSGQREAGEAVGLTRWQVLRAILLPQAFRTMLPALISQLVVVLKDTSLGFIISYQELVRTAGILVQNLGNPIPVYLVIAAIFILINYLLSRLAVLVEARLSRGRKATFIAAAAEPATG